MLILPLLFLSFPLQGQQKQVCFSIDDLPVVSYGMNDTCFQRGITDRLIASFLRYRIPAIGFVNEKKLYQMTERNPFAISLLEQWIAHGFEIGNHTYSHPDYNSVSLKEFTEDLVKGEILTKELLERYGQRMTYFRHPYLHMGNTKPKADSLNDFIASHGYTIAPVTIDTDDYLFAVAYQKARMKSDILLVQQIARDYLTYMETKLLHYEQESQALFGHHITQILLVHASWLNSEFMDSLAALYLSHGYSFVSMQTALQDPAYQTPISAFGKWGISWLDRWALSQGKHRDFFNGDPSPPEYITKPVE
jgi:peptidoglycan/xylan/chitin deacetylase (PgdA/CDA1 family)